MTTDHDETSFEPSHASSPTDHILTELQLHGYRPFQDEPDPRPLPEARTVTTAVADIFDALVGHLRVKPASNPTLRIYYGRPSISFTVPTSASNANSTTTSRSSGAVNVIRTAPRSARSKLERLTAEGITLIERRNTMEFFRDQAAEHFVHHTGSQWRPRSGSMVNHRALTAAMIDSRDFLAAKRRSRNRSTAACRAKDRLHRRSRTSTITA